MVAAPPVPCNTLEWPILISLACNRLELGRLLSNSATRTAAAHQFTSIPLPSYTCSALLPLLHLHLPLTYKSALPWPRWCTHSLDATTSLQDIFQHQFHLLQQIKAMAKILCQLIDCLLHLPPLSLPQKLLGKSSFAELHPTKNLPQT